jgi:hypothetical protein
VNSTQQSINGESEKPLGIADYRAAYREEFISPTYSGNKHLAFTSGMSLLIIAICIFNLDQPTWLEWLTVPLTFVYANFAEWAGHKNVMHKPVKGLGLIYRRHSLQHHRFFTHVHMPVDSTQDYKAVLFPPVLVTFFLVAFFLPVALFTQWVFGDNAALLLVITGVAYFLNYELLHFSYHLPNNHWVHHIPGFETLKALHTTHHDQRVMAHKNFNITYPIADYFMKTWKR